MVPLGLYVITIFYSLYSEILINGLIIFFLILIVVWLLFNNSSKNCYFSEISDGKSLLRRSNKDNVLFKLDVINGTIWLSHSGDVRSFSPVLGIPPATSSDMSLATAMQKLSEVTMNSIQVLSCNLI